MRAIPVAESAMRWLLLLASLGAFALAFTTKSTAMMALGLLAGFGFLFMAVFAFAAARIEETSRPDAAMLTDGDINKLKASLRKPGAPQAERLPPPQA